MRYDLSRKSVLGLIIGLTVLGGRVASAADSAKVILDQTSVKVLEVGKNEFGESIGRATDLTLSVTAGGAASKLNLEFPTKPIKDIDAIRDDTVTFVALTYPTWNAGSAKVTFDDKLVNRVHSDIGTAMGVVARSAIEGFKIDPLTAITGDLTVDGKVKVATGIGVKIKGAAQYKCAYVGLPTDNYDEMLDAVLYDGPAVVTDVQVIGLSAAMNVSIYRIRIYGKARDGKQPKYYQKQPFHTTKTAIHPSIHYRFNKGPFCSYLCNL